MREQGYYWIKHKTGTWTIARWIGDEWQTFDWEGFYKDSDFEEIDERRIKREQPKLTPEEIARKTEELRISQSMGDRINDIDNIVS